MKKLQMQDQACKDESHSAEADAEKSRHVYPCLFPEQKAEKIGRACQSACQDQVSRGPERPEKPSCIEYEADPCHCKNRRKISMDLQDSVYGKSTAPDRQDKHCCFHD